jgi:hypothetical protein
MGSSAQHSPEVRLKAAALRYRVAVGREVME